MWQRACVRQIRVLLGVGWIVFLLDENITLLCWLFVQRIYTIAYWNKSTRRLCVAGFFAKPTFSKGSDAVVAKANTTGYAKLILSYMCVDFTSPLYFIGSDSFGGAWVTFEGAPGLATSLILERITPDIHVSNTCVRCSLWVELNYFISKQSLTL